MAVDANVVNSIYGKEIKNGIINTIISIDGHEGITDISSNLATISTGIYGESIRTAIYEALVKTYNFAMPWVGTQSEYDALETKLQNCLYIIVPD